VADKSVEQMPYRGESPQDRHAFAQYMDEAGRGKSLLALIEMRKALTLDIRKSWYEGTFTPIETSQGTCDELTCNLAYHFGKHGAKYGDIAKMTTAAQQYFALNRSKAKLIDGKLKFPNGGVFMPDGRIVTFY
jgi:hypothetical protein